MKKINSSIISISANQQSTNIQKKLKKKKKKKKKNVSTLFKIL